MLKSIDSFFECFSIFEKKNKPQIISTSDEGYYFKIIVDNVYRNGSTYSMLQTFFGNSSVQVNQIKNSQSLEILISKVLMPNNGYYFVENYKAILSSKENNFFLGIGHYGPIYLDKNGFTHLAIYGASGFGKSFFFKSLLTQNLINDHKSVNYIIDLKKVDYSYYKRHPNVAAVLNDFDDIKALFHSLQIECGYREVVFNENFEIPPVNFDEYNLLRNKYSSKKIPELKRIFVWIDESRLLFHNSFDDEELMTVLLRKSRAFGIHFIFASQEFSDLSRGTIRSQIPNFVTFFSPGNRYADEEQSIAFKKIQSIPGRFIFYNSKNLESYEGHAPIITSEESVALSFRDRMNLEKISGITRLKIPSSLMKDCFFSIKLSQGSSIKSIIHEYSLNKKTILGFRKNKSYNFENFFDLIEDEAPQKETESKKVESNIIPTAEELLLEYEDILGNLDKVVKSEVKTQEVDIDNSRQVFIDKFKTQFEFEKINNESNFDQLINELTLIIDQSNENFIWSTSNIEANEGISKILKSRNLVHDINNVCVDLNDLAISLDDLSIINSWIDTIRKDNFSKSNSPMLILAAQDGFGKKTIVDAISKKIERECISGLLFENGIEKNNDEFLDKVLIFENLFSATRYKNLIKSSTPIIYIHRFKKENYNESLDVFFESLKEVDVPYLLVNLKSNYYLDPSIGNKLIQVLLSKFNFSGDNSKVTLKHFFDARIEINPKRINIIFEKASKLANYKNDLFLELHINQILGQEKLNSINKDFQLVQHKHAQFKLEDIFLNIEEKNKIQEMILKIKNSELTSYKFIKQLKDTKRLVSLFWGPPGTGKSMSAEVLASELGRKLWVCDMSKMQSAFVGGTEYLLSNIFDTAENADAVLLLDEADSFITLRDGASDYVRKISNHLLNLIENYKGTMVLTTNHIDLVDPAFLRRIDFTLQFKNPTEDQKCAILKSLLEPDAPLSPDVKFENLFVDLDLSGGLIRNAVERIAMRLIVKKITVIDQNILKETLNEVYNEYKATKNDKRKQIGITAK